MATEDQDAQRLLKNSALLCSYFIILESSVVFVCQQSDLLEAGAGGKQSCQACFLPPLSHDILCNVTLLF